MQIFSELRKYGVMVSVLQQTSVTPVTMVIADICELKIH